MEKLRGTGVAIVTPFKNGDVDFEALNNLINFLIDGGCNYIVSLGTTGETPVLSLKEKQQVLGFTVERVNNRVPVIAGAGGNNTAALIEEMKALPLEGISAILSASPYYNKPSQAGIVAHYQAIADAAPRPIILYNVPGRTGRNMTAETTLSLASHGNIMGMKEASGDMLQCMEILRNKPENFEVVSGDDALALAQIACGMTGVISVAANAFPAIFSTIVNECLNENFKAAVKLNNQLIPAYDMMFSENNPAVIKAFLAEKGLINNELRLPGVPVSTALNQRIKDFVQMTGQ